MRDRHLTAVFAWGVLTLIISGCGPAEKPAPTGLVPFTGTVTLDDKPMDGARVIFIPDAAPGSSSNIDAGALTDAQGKYELRSSEGRFPGAMPGNYRVVITRLARPDGSVVAASPDKSPMELMTQENAKESIPAQFSDFMGTKLKVTIPSGGGSHDFKLTGK